MVERPAARARTSSTSACSRRWSACRASSSSPRGAARGPTRTPRCRSATARRSRSRTWSRRICEVLGLTRPRARARRRHGLRLPGRGARRARRGGAHDRADPRARRAGAARTSPRPGYEHVDVHVGDGSLGLPEHAPFDAIAVAAAAPEPAAARSTTSSSLGGRLAVPVGGRWGQRLELIVRSPEGPAVVALGPVPVRAARRRGRLREVKRRTRRRHAASSRASSSGRRRVTGRARSGVAGWVRNVRRRNRRGGLRGRRRARRTRWSTGAGAARRGARVEDVEVDVDRARGRGGLLDQPDRAAR